MKTKLKAKLDKIETIKALLLERIEKYEKFLAELRAKLQRIEEVEDMLPSLIPFDMPGVDLSQTNEMPRKPGKPYEGLNLTEAIKLALVHAGPSPKTLRELRNMLTHGGYIIPETKKFSTRLNATLYRLETQGLVVTSEDIEGRKTFMRKI